MKIGAIVESIEEYRRIQSAIEELHDVNTAINDVWHKHPVQDALFGDICNAIKRIILDRIAKLEYLRNNIELD